MPMGLFLAFVGTLRDKEQGAIVRLLLVELLEEAIADILVEVMKGGSP